MSTFSRLMWLIFCVLLNFNLLQAEAQEITWDEFVEQITDPEDEQVASWSYLIDELFYIHEHPININTVSTEVLQQLPFLNALQIEAIQAYVYTQGPVLSIGELNLIPELDFTVRQWLSLFITFGEKEETKNKGLSTSKLLQYGKHEIMLKTSIPFYKLDEKYTGSALSHTLRYQYKLNERIEWGLTADKDAGEPFFKGINKKGYDHYSFYTEFRNIGKVKMLALGHYRLSFGQGLVLNSSFSLGKLSMLTNFDYGGYKGISKHASTSEYGYFQGAALQFAFQKWDVFAFVSYQQADATLQGDTLISTLITDGYHRTETEIKKKNNINNFLIGSNLSYNYNDFHIGFTSLYNVFNKMFRTYESPHYKTFYPAGPAFLNASIDYAYKNYHFSVRGELAMSQNGGWATLHTLQYRPSSRWTYQLLYRYYQPRYISLNGHAFGESSTVNNENGLYMGVLYKPVSSIQLSAYLDAFEFPWTKYQVAALHSKGFEAALQLRYTPKVGWEIGAKYRFKQKQKTYTPESTSEKMLVHYTTQTARFQCKYPISVLQGNTQFTYSRYQLAANATEIGYGISQQFVYKIKPSLELSLFGMYFNTDTYNCRVYGYEKNLLYSFSYPSYYGQGIRISTTVKYTILPHILLFLKYGNTFYLKDDKPSRSQLQVQIRCKF